MKRISRPALPFALAVAFAAASDATAYPLFYKCDATGRMSDFLDTRDIETAVLAATDEAGLERKLVDLCAGRAECFAILKQMLILTQSTFSAVKELLAEEIAQLEAKRDELNQAISPDLSDAARNVVAMANEVHACRKTQEGLSPTLYLRSDRDEISGETSGQDLFIHHRVDNEYRQYTGVKDKDESPDAEEPRNHRVDYDQVATVVRDAIAADLDPYLALAISFMEAGKPQRFKLDPGPLLGMIGCPNERVARVNHEDAAEVAAQEAALRAQGVPFVYSFGSFFRIAPGIRERKDISKLMLDQKEYYDAEAALSPALACKQGKNTFLARPNGEILEVLEEKVAPDLAVAKACCARIPYASDEFFSAAANVFLKEKVGSNPDPARAIQKFNGTGVIGLSEKAGVGAFRYGIDMGDDPQYGYQAMDTLLNDLLGNSTVRWVVEDTKKELGRNPKSVLCSGKGAGAYAVDHDHYLRKQKEIVRLKPFIGRAWDALGKLERSSMAHEMERAMEWKTKDHPKLDAAGNAALRSGLAKMAGAGDASARWEAFRRYVYPYRKTLYQTSTMSWDRLTNQETADLRMKILAAPPQK